MAVEAQGFKLMVKNNENNYISLFPKTIKNQVIDYSMGSVYGPYNFTLETTGWTLDSTSGMYKQTVTLADVLETDIVYCIKVLTGDAATMIAQDEAYSLLHPYLGVESLNGSITFAATAQPTVDFQVQVSWTR